MKTRFVVPALFLALLFTVQAALHAQNLRFAGVLGNSGEQGDTLIRFAPFPAHGLGVVFDRYGTIWDRAGGGLLNRYALDGRLLASYPLPQGDYPGDRQTLTPAGILLLIDGKLYRLSIDAPPGTRPTSLAITASKMSFAASNGNVALLQNEQINILDTKTLTLKTAVQDVNPKDVGDLSLLDDGSILIEQGRTARLYRDGHEITDGWPRTVQSSHLQHIGQFFFAEGFHGTVYRFNNDLEPSPGVVLGGASGSFIGHVDGDEELSLGNGVAVLGPDIAAVSGRFGIVDLLQWDQSTDRYTVARRLGSALRCKGLAINDAGSIWFNSGRWDWDDLPTSPIWDSVSGGGYVGQVASLNGGTFLAAIQREADVRIFQGSFSWNSHTANGMSLPGTMLNAAAVYTQAEGKKIFLLMDPVGNALAFPLDANNLPAKEPAHVEFEFASPVRQLTTLAMKTDAVMLAAADGSILHLEMRGNTWHESSRWNRWGPADSEHFGPQVFIAADDGHLWVSDTDRNRVLCFNLHTGKLLAAFGQPDQPGSDLSHLSQPAAIAARHSRAVVFDSGNQRLVKLLLDDAH